MFDGTNEGEYSEEDLTNHKNEYGRAKLAGEQAMQEICRPHYIVRTSWIFGEFGKNFVFTMKCLSEKHDRLTVVSDQTSHF